LNAPQANGPQANVQGGAARISFRPASLNTQLNTAVTATIYAENVTNLQSAAAQIRFDPAILRVNNILLGDLTQKNAPALMPTKNILNDTGVADMSVTRGTAEGPASGSGVLFTVVFQAVGRGNTNVTVTSSSITGATGAGAGGQAQQVAPPPPLIVNVN
jgi:hypothetical protein